MEDKTEQTGIPVKITITDQSGKEFSGQGFLEGEWSASRTFVPISRWGAWRRRAITYLRDRRRCFRAGRRW